MVQTDIRCVADIECQSLSPWSAQSIQDELASDQSITLVAEWGDMKGATLVAGWCTARFIPPEAELLKIAVSNTLRQNGVGKALLLHLFTLLHEKGVETLFLEVRSQNHIALKFYANSGFLQVGERKNYYAHPDDDALILQCTINTINTL